ncbi:MAG: cohesin domain-containing protein [Patescibacteria group bacterium]|mgnify:CR=1 FL=1
MNIVKKNCANFIFIPAGVTFLFFVFFSSHAQSSPASLFVGPSSGTYVVGSTFTVSIFVNTNSQSINAIQADLKFPSDKLQVVSPSAGKSFVGVWVVQPTYDNRKGSIKFQGAIPNPGINTNAGLISEITFRVVSVGTAVIRFEDTSRVLLNDGRGTDVLGQTTGGIYNLALPPPAGPAVSSPTHSDQEKWYSNRNVGLQWGSDEPVQGYSYVVNNQPIDIPDDISEGQKTTQSYKNLSDDIYYFHIKALRSGSWGGVTHYSLKIDGTPPAHFTIEINPKARTVTRKPVINFQTTDALSGLDHYELKIVGLTLPEGENIENRTAQNFFIEANSPYIPELSLGEYDVFVRAFDKAGNYVQEIQRLVITTSFFSVVQTKGLTLWGNFVLPWAVVWGIGILAIIFAVFLVYRSYRRHTRVDAKHRAGELPEEIRKKLEELTSLREKYKGIFIFFLYFGISFVIPLAGVYAQNANNLESPPIITQVSKNITNREIFYVGGVAVIPNSQIVLYLQNYESGETVSMNVTADKNGEWFYTHSKLLSAGIYSLWAQARVGEVQSPPSPQIRLTVSAAALQLGTSRLSYEAVYFMIALALLLVLLILICFALYHRRQAKKKHRKLLEDIREAEESIKRGFAVLSRDIRAELLLIQKAKESGSFSERERSQEEKILRDLEIVEKYIGKEIWEIEREA